ncbi:MAG: flagellar type III secretion system pore protein FliP [Thermotogaceae bacterium]|nr:flagellar type III secretion system pore protein FliP [Thermotogaceae bacterium]
MARILALFFIILFVVGIYPQEIPPLPEISINVGPSSGENPQTLVVTLEILLVLTVLTLAPSILILFTSFTRVLIVFSFLRNGLGTRMTPPTQVLIGIALFLTFLIMQPVFNDMWNSAVVPYMNKEISYKEMFGRIMDREKEFMLGELVNHHNEDDIFVIANSAGVKIDKIEDAPFSVLVPAFILGELEVGFKMGVLLYIPFIVVDMIVASILLAMGMIMIPPIFVSLPFKVLLFVMVNGWDLVIGGLIKSFAH